jgi:hypothetical protein
MRRAMVRPVWVTWISSMVVLLGCGGQELLDLGGDAGQSRGEGHAASSGSDGASSASGNGDAGNGTSFAPGIDVACGGTVCSAPDVCCVNQELSAMFLETKGSCAPRDACEGGVAVVTCTALSCLPGSVCCVSGYVSPNAEEGYPDSGFGMETAECFEGSSCPSGQVQACVPQAESPPQAGYVSDCPDAGLCTCDYALCACP